MLTPPQSDLVVEALEPFTRTNPHKNEPGESAILIGCTVADVRRAKAAIALARNLILSAQSRTEGETT